MPRKEDRYLIWDKGFSKKCRPDENVDLRAIARNYELSGGSIMNIIQYATLITLNKGLKHIQESDLIDGVRREFYKTGRSI